MIGSLISHHSEYLSTRGRREGEEDGNPVPAKRHLHFNPTGYGLYVLRSRSAARDDILCDLDESKMEARTPVAI
jgi:hypothetical protein